MHGRRIRAKLTHIPEYCSCDPAGSFGSRDQDVNGCAHRLRTRVVAVIEDIKTAHGNKILTHCHRTELTKSATHISLAKSEMHTHRSGYERRLSIVPSGNGYFRIEDYTFRSVYIENTSTTRVAKIRNIKVRRAVSRRREIYGATVFCPNVSQKRLVAVKKKQSVGRKSGSYLKLCPCNVFPCAEILKVRRADIGYHRHVWTRGKRH